MRRKKRGPKLAFVGRHRARRRRRKSLGGALPLEPRTTGEAAPAAGDAAATGKPPHPPWFDASNPRPEPLYRTIPLRVDDGPATGDAPPDPEPGSPESDGSSASTNWLGLDTGAVVSEPGHWAPWPAAPQPGVAGPQDATGADGAAGADPLETLDSVVHNFVASLDQQTFAQTGSVASSAHAERFQRLLAHSPATNGQVLGPPVLLGASPAVGLESMLGLLGSLRKTGILRVQAPGVLFMISIVRGDVVHGVSNPRPASELLGNLLVSRGTIGVEGLARFLDEVGSSPSRIAEALNRQALVSTDELKGALEHQLQLLFDRLLSTRESVWCFHEGEATLAYINMRMSVISVLLETARKNDERPGA